MAGTPRVSILIPNFNNGRESSKSGDYDFIGRLLWSLMETLRDDPTPFEVLALDDGSSDDSLATLRDWAANKTWADGRQVLELIEREHCGVLSVTANELSRRARGNILARLDGDVLCLTQNWVSKLCAVFDQGPASLGVVGPKQLRPDMKIHAYGDWVLHPKGYVHIAAGLDRHSVRHPLEVDHVMGCFYCCRKTVWEKLDGYDESFLRGQTVDFGLRARLEGFSCIAVPHIEYAHLHTMRRTRATTADSKGGVDDSLKTFEKKWGFSRIAPDLDVVRKRFGGTPLLWNARWFGAPAEALDSVREDTGPVPPLEETEWGAYTRDAAVRAHVDLRAAVVSRIAEQTAQPRFVAVVGCGCGLIVHVLAGRGFRCIGIDRHAASIDLGRQCTSGRVYAGGGSAAFEHQQHRTKLPLADAQADMLLICDQMEKHPNPAGLLQEARRVLAPGGPLCVVSKRKDSAVELSTDTEHRYEWQELLNQVAAVGGFDLLCDPDGDNPERDMVLVVRRKGEMAAAKAEVGAGAA